MPPRRRPTVFDTSPVHLTGDHRSSAPPGPVPYPSDIPKGRDCWSGNSYGQTALVVVALGCGLLHPSRVGRGGEAEACAKRPHEHHSAPDRSVDLVAASPDLGCVTSIEVEVHVRFEGRDAPTPSGPRVDHESASGEVRVLFQLYRPSRSYRYGVGACVLVGLAVTAVDRVDGKESACLQLVKTHSHKGQTGWNLSRLLVGTKPFVPGSCPPHVSVLVSIQRRRRWPAVNGSRSATPPWMVVN